MSIFEDDALLTTEAEQKGFTDTAIDWETQSVTFDKVSQYPINGISLLWRSQLTIFPEAYKTAISTRSYIHPTFRGNGQGSTKHKITLELAKIAGLKTLLCTVNNTNWSQIKILLNNNWKAITPISETSTLWKKDL